MEPTTWPGEPDPARAPAIGWRRVTEADFPLLQRWLRQPRVARWWNHDTSTEAVARDFGPSARGEEPSEDWLALMHGEPFGLLQRARVADYPKDLAKFSTLVAVPEGAMQLDYLIGEPEQGLGPQMIRSAVHAIWADRPEAPSVLVAVVAANRASWRALEKAGLTRVAAGPLEPDNPVDDPLRYVYRIDRLDDDPVS